MTEIPDGLPSLSSGSHREGSGKACVMEYVSVLAGTKWTDVPECTNPTLAYFAQAVNDSLGDDVRHRLVPLIGRLLAAGERGLVSRHLRVEARLYVLSMGGGAVLNSLMLAPIVAMPDNDYASYCVTDLRNAAKCAARCAGHSEGNLPADIFLLQAEYQAVRDEYVIGLLVHLLDAYEKYTGTAPEPVSSEALSRARELISTGKGLI